jgi:SagB-type dehydrogenase family enzyme
MAVPAAGDRLLTRRRFGLLLAGGAVAAAVTGDSRLGADRGLHNGRAPSRVRVLPAPDATGSVPLEATLATRRSIRAFRDEPLSLTELGQLLWAAQGVTRPWGGRTAPSAGALYPLDLYVVLPDRLWHYLPSGHRIEEWSLAGDRRARLHQTAATAPAVVVLVGTVDRTAWKYPTRADRFVALEAGHCAQNLVLQATALGLAAVTLGSVSQDTVRRTLRLPASQSVYYLIPIGRAATGA